MYRLPWHIPGLSCVWITQLHVCVRNVLTSPSYVKMTFWLPSNHKGNKCGVLFCARGSKWSCFLSCRPCRPRKTHPLTEFVPEVFIFPQWEMGDKLYFCWHLLQGLDWRCDHAAERSTVCDAGRDSPWGHPPQQDAGDLHWHRGIYIGPASHSGGVLCCYSGRCPAVSKFIDLFPLW